jgi:hypothetical protein
MGSLEPLASLEYGQVRLAGDRPAVGATARVYERRGRRLRPLAVYADDEASQLLDQPLVADLDGELPGFVNPRRVDEIVAEYRGRTISSGQAREAAEAEQATAEAERAAEEAREADRRTRRRERARLDALTRRAAAAKKAREDAKAAEALEAERAAVMRRNDRERVRRWRAARIQAYLASVPAERLTLGPSNPIRSTTITTQVFDEIAQTPLVTIYIPDYEPFYDPDHSADVVTLAPTFGIDSNGNPYYDPTSPNPESSLMSISPNLEYALSTP